LSFAGVRIVTLAEGEIGHLHVGLKGTMNALYLKDLADKTRRGLRGRVEAGKSGGGLCFGYRVVRTLGAEGVVTGERVIDTGEASGRCSNLPRICRGSVASSDRQAAERRACAWSWRAHLGTEHVARPCATGTGILNNELYIGRLVWNRQRYVKDPDTGRRVSRPNPAADLIVTEVPGLRILSDEAWQAAKTRQQQVRQVVATGGNIGRAMRPLTCSRV
jgi:hypothetical protein